MANIYKKIIAKNTLKTIFNYAILLYYNLAFYKRKQENNTN